ncbi:uncharacterized protein BDR25DRAFT_351087 [Lindgomyces ingoldianus]|uniref:Uncharacterized protein n=1 Tax=Lindgomyces ingoldianus TaxID=673940 RepID=A0ACB6R5H2_9PLEO|nr:uncharacterized protein BDR25DRAFT_351087 [Lindgomyces ingoldianus]KAF2474559.1 hypothetical protein BDR25DRAFT_351087 [Lindgomyces ingoldianus]
MRFFMDLWRTGHLRDVAEIDFVSRMSIISWRYLSLFNLLAPQVPSAARHLNSASSSFDVISWASSPSCNLGGYQSNRWELFVNGNPKQNPTFIWQGSKYALLQIAETNRQRYLQTDRQKHHLARPRTTANTKDTTIILESHNHYVSITTILKYSCTYLVGRADSEHTVREGYFESRSSSNMPELHNVSRPEHRQLMWRCLQTSMSQPNDAANPRQLRRATGPAEVHLPSQRSARHIFHRCLIGDDDDVGRGC